MQPSSTDWNFAHTVLGRNYDKLMSEQLYYMPTSRRLALASVFSRLLESRKGFQLLIVGDCKGLFEAMAGEASLDADLAKPYFENAQNKHLQLIEGIPLCTFRTLGSHFYWTRRSGNKGPDYLCNRILDDQVAKYEFWNPHAIGRLFDLLLWMDSRPYDRDLWPAIVLRTDAAYRTRAGTVSSSGAAVLEIVKPAWGSNLRTPLGLWAEAFGSEDGGVSDSFIAEARALALAMESLLSFLLHLTELLFDSALASRPALGITELPW
jgi:hypothetical protein